MVSFGGERCFPAHFRRARKRHNHAHDCPPRHICICMLFGPSVRYLHDNMSANDCIPRSLLLLQIEKATSCLVYLQSKLLQTQSTSNSTFTVCLYTKNSKYLSIVIAIGISSVASQLFPIYLSSLSSKIFSSGGRSSRSKF